MRGMIKEVISAVATGASLVSLLSFTGLQSWARLLIMLAGIGSTCFLIYSIIKANQINEVVCESNEEIQSKMKEIIKMQGKICILSRDLSWMNSDIVTTIKGKASSVLIFAENPTKETRELQEAGVRVKYYGYTGFTPKTRFTVVRYNKEDRQVAIANTRNAIRRKSTMKHTIYMTEGNSADKRDLWINSLALDMINLFECAIREDNDANNEKQ